MTLGINDREHRNQLWVIIGTLIVGLSAFSGGWAWYFARHDTEMGMIYGLQVEVATLKAQQASTNDLIRDMRDSDEKIGQKIQEVLVALPGKENVRQR